MKKIVKFLFIYVVLGPITIPMYFFKWILRG